jgi:bifunctional enzyme CysN/CysC
VLSRRFEIHQHRDFASKLSIQNLHFIPISALQGDNVVHASVHMPWYTGPYLLEQLERIPARDTTPVGPFRLPVQFVLRDGLDFRGLAGTVSSGRVCVGDRITDALSGKSAHVLRIATMGRDLEVAQQGQAVALQLEFAGDPAIARFFASAIDALIARGQRR